MSRFPFGLDRDAVTKQFEVISEGLKNGDVIPHAVSYSEDQTDEEFRIRTVTLKFAMKEPGNG